MKKDDTLTENSSQSSSSPGENSWRSELFRTLISGLAFFFLIGSYYIIKPTRKPILLEHLNLEYLNFFYLISPITALAVIFIYNRLVSRYPRTQLIRIFFLANILILTLFGVVFRWSSPLFGSGSFQDMGKFVEVIQKRQDQFTEKLKGQFSETVLKKINLYQPGQSWHELDPELKLIKDLNQILTRPTFLEREVWENLPLPPELQQKVVASEKLEGKELILLQRQLLSLAYPNTLPTLPWAPDLGLVAAIYFLFASVYILFFIALFWSFNHDIHTPNQSKTFYPYISLGGQVGVLCFSSLAAQYTPKVGTYNLVFFSLAGLVVSWLFLEILKKFDPYWNENQFAKPQETGTWQDFTILYQNRYAFAIGMLILLSTFAATICDLQFTELVDISFASADEQTHFYAQNNQYMAIGNILMCLLFTPLLLRSVGPAIAITLYPVVLIALAICFVSEASIYTARYFAVAALTLNYTLYVVGKETFYVPTDKTVKYKMKALCETVVFRLGDSLASLSRSLYLIFFVWIFGLSFMVFAIALIWLPAIYVTGKMYQKQIAEPAS